jgi:hypothetical protein
LGRENVVQYLYASSTLQDAVLIAASLKNSSSTKKAFFIQKKVAHENKYFVLV